MRASKHELIAALRVHQSAGLIERRMQFATLRFVEAEDHPFSPNNPAGHVTASPWVLSPDGGFALLTHHAKLDAWFQLGGHLDDDASVSDAALREAREESGLLSLCPAGGAIFDIDVHIIPARGTMPNHPHHDIRYLFQADPSEQLVPTTETRALRWVALDEVVALNASESIQRMVRKSRQLMSSNVTE